MKNLSFESGFPSFVGYNVMVYEELRKFIMNCVNSHSFEKLFIQIILFRTWKVRNYSTVKKIPMKFLACSSSVQSSNYFGTLLFKKLLLKSNGIHFCNSNAMAICLLLYCHYTYFVLV